jgi:hypothetical protein
MLYSSAVLSLLIGSASAFAPVGIASTRGMRTKDAHMSVGLYYSTTTGECAHARRALAPSRPVCTHVTA